MGEDCNPWQFSNFNHGSNAEAHDVAKQSPTPMAFPACADPYGFFQMNSALMPPSHPTGFASGQKRFMVFDRSGDQTNLIYSSFGSQFPYPYPTTIGLPASNQADVSTGNVNEEMHEDTEEIDALLYSDSDDDHEEEEEDASTGHYSPVETTITNSNYEEEEEITLSAVFPPPLPAKRRRIDSEFDPSLTDTASSSIWVGNMDNKKAKREKIQETVGVLRQIVPGSKGKDATTVLDEAIRYLKSLKLKAKGLKDY